MEQLRTLYPEIKENFSEMLDVDGTHTIYYEESGNPNGVPVIFLHGGAWMWDSPKLQTIF